MKNFSLATLALAATFAFSSAKAATTDNNVSFSSISFADGIDIEMVEGNAPAIESSDVTYTIDNAGVLTLKASANNGGNSHVRICAPDLKAIQYFGDSNVSVTGNIQANKLLVSTSGKGDITFDSLTSHDIVCGVLGKGNTRINCMKAQNAKCAIYGSGKVFIANEKSDNIVANHSRLRVSDCRYTLSHQGTANKACFTLSNVKARTTSTGDLALR